MPTDDVKLFALMAKGGDLSGRADRIQPSAARRRTLDLFAKFLEDRTPRVEYHDCPTCGCRYSWLILPPLPEEVPDDLPRIEGIPADCVNCLLYPPRS